jgi:hypothetical protein
MRKVLRAGSFAFCIFLAITVFPQTSEWKEYVYADDGFAIVWPSQPVIQKRIMKSKAGDVEAHLYHVPLENYQLLFMCAPLHPNDQRTPKQALEDAKKGPNLTGAKLISEKSISLGRYPGIEIETEDGR